MANYFISTHPYTYKQDKHVFFCCCFSVVLHSTRLLIRCESFEVYMYLLMSSQVLKLLILSCLNTMPIAFFFFFHFCFFFRFFFFLHLLSIFALLLLFFFVSLVFMLLSIGQFKWYTLSSSAISPHTTTTCQKKKTFIILTCYFLHFFSVEQCSIGILLFFTSFFVFCFFWRGCSISVCQLLNHINTHIYIHSNLQHDINFIQMSLIDHLYHTRFLYRPALSFSKAHFSLKTVW